MTTGSFIDDLRDIPGFNELSTKPRDRGLRVTGEDADGDYDDSGDDLGTKSKTERETFPCESCSGTGRYRGVRIHQPEEKCFACKGRGFYYKSFKDRQASKAKRAARKQQVIANAVSDFEQAHPGLLEGMRKHSSWNDFLRDLVGRIDAGKDISERAIEAARRAVDKANARDAEKAAAAVARVTNAPAINTDALRSAFDKASATGLKRPKLRYEGFEVSRAPDHGKNAGALYVKASNDTYLGKIVDGKYIATRETEAAGLVAKVVEAMQDPFNLAVAYGRRTGNCSCCGRKLTDKLSVANGIGPICADKYGWDIVSHEDIPQLDGTKAAPKATATKYEYPAGMTADEKRKFRAAARRQR